MVLASHYYYRQARASPCLFSLRCDVSSIFREEQNRENVSVLSSGSMLPSCDVTGTLKKLQGLISKLPGTHYEFGNQQRVDKTIKLKTELKKELHQPGIEPGSVPWQGTILPLDHWCCYDLFPDLLITFGSVFNPAAMFAARESGALFPLFATLQSTDSQKVLRTKKTEQDKKKN
jgi:hypothetical protein